MTALCATPLESTLRNDSLSGTITGHYYQHLAEGRVAVDGFGEKHYSCGLAQIASRAPSWGGSTEA